MDEQRNYTGSAFWITLIVVVMTVGMSLIPGFQVGRASVKRVNILSDLIRQEEHPRLEEADLYFDTTFLAEGRADRGGCRLPIRWLPTRPEDGKPPNRKYGSWYGICRDTGRCRARSLRERGNGNRFGGARCDRGFRRRGSGHGAFLPYDARKGSPAAVRIAVLGDSFIEGDIVTADVRERMQDLYGGCGVGFVPFSSPIALYRATVRHTFDGWKTYDVKAFRKVPEDVRDKFFVSGNVCIPQQGATARMEGVTFRRHIDAGARGADSVYQSGQHLAARRGQRLARARFPARARVLWRSRS